jgi:hypothetical protein
MGNKQQSSKNIKNYLRKNESSNNEGQQHPGPSVNSNYPNTQEFLVINNQHQNIFSFEQMTKLKKYVLKSTDLMKIFRYYAIGGKYLNYDKFNDCIMLILRGDASLPIISNTHLSEKLFFLMDRVNNLNIYRIIKEKLASLNF